MGIDIQQQWDAVRAAPVLYLGAIAVVGAAVWLVLAHMKSNRIESLEERIRLRDDEIADYKRQLDGASPDQARSRIDALEARLEALMPRRVTSEQRESIRVALAGSQGSISIGSDIACADAPAVNAGLTAAFRNAGWSIQNPGMMGLANPPASGLGVRCVDPANPTILESAVMRALQSAGLNFDTQAGRDVTQHEMLPQMDAEIVITPRVMD